MKQCPKCNAQYSNDQAICPIDAGVLVDSNAQDNPVAADPMIGRLIADKYRVEKLLGRGGMGAVYEGQHLLLDRRVAIKVLQQNMANDEQAASRFIREAKASARIEHPNAVTIYDFGVLQEGSAYLVMEFIGGLSLRQMLVRKDIMKAEQVVDWMVQVCSVVEAAHKQGIIHRDLKPENVMLKESPDGSVAVKVVDFGLAKLTSESTADKSSAHLTKPGEMLGTPHYMAPEYYEGEAIDARADIYAIGIMMYELFCGDTPFTGTVQSIIGGHLFKDPLPIIKTNPTIPPVLDKVVQKALKKNRDERITSAIELAQELKEAKEIFLQKHTSKIEPITTTLPEGDNKNTQTDIASQENTERSTIMQNEGEQLKTERVIPATSRSTVKISDMEEIFPNAPGKSTQQMAFGTMQVSQEFIDQAKEPLLKKAELSKQTEQEKSVNTADSDVGFTSAPTKPQHERVKIITPPTAPPKIEPIPPTSAPNTIPATVPVASTNPLANAPATSGTLPPTTLSTNPLTQPAQPLAPEYENFSDVIVAIKGQLLVGSIIVFLLAIMVTLLIIYRLEAL